MDCMAKGSSGLELSETRMLQDNELQTPLWKEKQLANQRRLVT